MNEEYDRIIPEGEEQETVNLAGYQVAKAELFAHTREPAITVWENKIKFNMACLRKFPGVKYIQLLIHPEEFRLIVRPCEADAPDSLRWANGGGEKEKNKTTYLLHRQLMVKKKYLNTKIKKLFCLLKTKELF